MGVLTVYLDKCTGLADKDAIGKSDPYVTMTVKEDNWGQDDDVGQQKSSVKEGSNPEYGETYFFTIPELKDHYLYMSVKDEDVGKDDKLGYCKIDLDGLTEEPQEIVKTVDNNVFAPDGKIYVKLSYKEE